MHGSGRKQEGAVEFIDNYINHSKVYSCLAKHKWYGYHN